MKNETVLPLDGVVVVAIEQAVAGPFCTMRLADAGATVIKVERPEGDFARGYDDVVNGESSYFVWLNRGKKSIIVDLSQASARAELEGLLAKADVLVQNLKPGALDKVGLGPAALRKKHPRLITCSISGYGEEGPLASRKAYDLLIQAESGLCSITGTPESPARVGISLVDISTGATAYAAILEALLTRARTGIGADIRVSMFDVIAEWLAVPLLQEEGGKPPHRIGLGHVSIAPYSVFHSRDGRELLISIQSDREWRLFAQSLLGNAALGTDPRFATNVARVRHRSETDGLVADAFGKLSHDDLVAALSRADIAFAELNSMADLSRHPHLRRIEVQTQAGPARIPAPGAVVVGQERHYGPVPSVGEHSLASLQRLLGETDKDQSGADTNA
jgi:crotonobetainyl-CoA:carnitine CoA-transferase CaiB-like acyl-CoA transferase